VSFGNNKKQEEDVETLKTMLQIQSLVVGCDVQLVPVAVGRISWKTKLARRTPNSSTQIRANFLTHFIGFIT
jgi:hypothetical protein